MSTKWIAGAQGLVLGLGGLLLLFVPGEAAALLGLPAGPAVEWTMQLWAASLLGWGVVNWLARGGPLGGIYGRPILAGNLMHFGVATLSLVRAVLDTGGTVPWVLCGVCGLLFLATYYLMRADPLRSRAGGGAKRGEREGRG